MPPSLAQQWKQELSEVCIDAELVLPGTEAAPEETGYDKSIFEYFKHTIVFH
jgi:hypothetical protein